MRATLYIAATMLAFAGEARAQIPVSLDLGTGPSFQFGPLKTNTSRPGFNGLVGLDYKAPFVPLSVRLEGLFDEYDHTSAYLGARQIWAISGNAVWSFPMFNAIPGLVPYVLGGGGYYHTSENIRLKNPEACAPSEGNPCPTPVQPSAPTLTAAHFGVDGGAGARYRLFGVGPGIGIGIFAEARYLQYFGPHSSAAMVPLIVGVNFPTAVTPGS